MNKSKLGLNTFYLKIIAVILMTLDHYAMFFISPGGGNIPIPSYYVLRAVGKMAFPIFAFCAVEAISHTSNKEKYLLRLFIFAYSLDAIGYIYGFIFNIRVRDNLILGNAIKDILFGTSMIYFLEQKGYKKLFALIPFILAWLSIVDTTTSFGTIVKTDWSSYSIMMFLFMYLARLFAKNYCNKKALELNVDIEEYNLLYLNKLNKYLEMAAIFLVGALYYLIFRLSNSAYLYPGKSSFIPVGTYCVLAVVFIFFYNYKPGPKNKYLKWSFYIYYPLHLFIFAIISAYVGVLSNIR